MTSVAGAGLTEAELRRRRQRRRRLFRRVLAGFSNPFILAVLAGFIGLMTSIITANINSQLARDAADRTAVENRAAAERTAKENRESQERQARYARDNAREELQSDLIKKFVEGPSVERVRANLVFLADAGLIPTYEKRIRAYLAAHPDRAPQVLSSGSVSGLAAPHGPFTPLNPQASGPIGSAARAVFQLTSGDLTCNAFSVGPRLVLNAGFCATDRTSIRSGGMLTRLSVVASENVSPGDPERPNFALLKSDRPIDAGRLTPGTLAPSVGDQLAILAYRSRDGRVAINSGCQVTAIHKATFELSCELEPGVAGAPVLSKDGRTVVGIATAVTAADGSGTMRAIATRIDAISREAWARAGP